MSTNPDPTSSNGKAHGKDSAFTREGFNGHATALIDQLSQLPDSFVREESCLPPIVGAFPIDVFPQLLRELVDQTSTFYQYRPDWIGSSILYAASVAVGNTIGIRYQTIQQKATLYMALIGMPGSNKSGPAEYAVKPLRYLDQTLYNDFKDQRSEFERWEKLTKKERLAEGLPSFQLPPAYKTLLVSDVTPEALIKTHQDNPYGLGLFADELSGWFQSFNRYNKGNEQEFWLQNWSFTPIKVVRKSSIPVYVTNPFISVLGTMQPGILGELSKEGRSHNGFIDRILFAYPDDQHKPDDSEGEPDEAILSRYGQCIRNLYELRKTIGATADGSPDTKQLGFSAQAAEVMKEWRIHSTDLINRTDIPPLKGVYAKLEVYCIRFCLLIELLDYGCELSDLSRIQASSVASAIRLVEYYRQNANKVYYALNQSDSLLTSLANQQMAEASTTQQRIYEALPETITTAEALLIASQMTPPISVSTVKRLLDNKSLFNRVQHGKYTKNGT